MLLALRVRYVIAALAFFGFNASIWGQSVVHVPADQPTIQAGIDAASNGDTVLVAPGTYVEAIDFKGKSIIVTSGATSYTNAGSVILEAPAEGAAVTLHSGEPVGATLNGFVITHGTDSTGVEYLGNGIDLANSSGTFTNNIVQGNGGCGVLAFKSPTVVLQGNRITGQHQSDILGVQFDCAYRDYQVPISSFGAGYAAVFVYWSGDARIAGNLIDNNDSLGLNGIVDFYTQASVIQNNVIHHNSFYGRAGIDVLGPQSVTVIQNLIYANSQLNYWPPYEHGVEEFRSALEISYAPLNAPVLYVPMTATVLNNTVAMNIITPTPDAIPQGFPEAFTMAGRFTGTTVANNIFATSQNLFPAVGCMFLDPASTVSFRNNDSYGGIPSNTSCSTISTDAGNITADPQFVSPSTFDFHTVPASPVVAAGDITVSPLPPADLDAKARTVCGTIDMGVYEVRPHPPVSLTSSPNPSVGGTLVTFPLKVSGNCNIPTGTVNLLDGQQNVGTAVLDPSGNAVISTAALTVGTHSMTVSYPGDFNLDQSTSNVVQQVVTGYPSATSAQVAPNPAGAFQPITFSALVMSQFGVPDGTVTFLAGANVLATVPVNGSGIASTTLGTLGAGTYSVTAVYNASVQYATSSSSPVALVVQGAGTSAKLTSTPNPSSFGQSVTFTTVVAVAQSTAIPTGLVTFRDGANVLGTSTINAGGSASLSTSSLSVGTHLISADYGGSPNANPSASNTLTQIVQPITTTVSVTGAPNPAALTQAVTFTAVVSPVSGTGVPAGAVAFVDQNGVLGNVPVANGEAVFTISTLATGTHNIVAIFTAVAGGNFAGASSPVFVETIQSFDFAVTLTPATLSLASGQQGLVQVSLNGVGNLPGNVQVNATQVPTYATLAFAPETVDFVAGGSASSVLSIDTAQRPQQALLESGARSHNKNLTLACATLAAFPFLFLGRRRGRVLFSLVGASLILTLTGCGNIYYPLNRVAPGKYSIPITATDTNTNITHTATLTLTVTP